MKSCGQCKRSKSLDAFNADKNSKDGKQRWCIVCSRQYAKDHYQKNTEYHSTKRERRKNKRAALKAKMVAYKGGKCQRCGYDKCLQALAFHHNDPQEKDFRLSGPVWTKPWDDIVKELDKCALVCHNCHSEIHEGLRTLD